MSKKRLKLDASLKFNKNKKVKIQIKNKILLGITLLLIVFYFGLGIYLSSMSMIGWGRVVVDYSDSAGISIITAFLLILGFFVLYYVSKTPSQNREKWSQ